MKRIILLLVTVSLTIICHSQQKELDSLSNLLKNHQIQEVTRINLLAEIAFAYCEIDPAKGLEAAEQAIALANTLDKKASLGKAYRHKGLNLVRLGKDSLAASSYQKALEIFEEINDEKGKATVFYNYAEIYANLGEYYKALNYLEKSSVFFEKQNSDFLRHIYNGKGNIYFSLSNYNKALEYYLKALPISEKTNDPETIATISGNIGVMFNNIGEHIKSLEYHQKALMIYQKTGNKIGIAFELEGIGNTYSNLNDSVKAIDLYRRALEINKSIGNKRGIANNLSNISTVYYHSGNYGEAMKYFPEAVKIYEELDDKYSLSTLLNIIADTYANAPDNILLLNGIKPTQRFVKADTYNRRALTLAKQAEALEKQDEILVSMVSVYEKQKNYKKAVEVYKELLPLHDSVINNKRKEEIVKQELKYEFDQKEALAAAEIQRQQTIRNVSIAGGAALLVASLLSFIFYKRKRDAEVEKTEAEFRVKVGDVEMKALRSQMNPHFIFNSLQSVNRYIMDNDKQKASDYLSKFSRLMRLILENSREHEVTLEEDLSALELYIQLEALRFHNKFQYTIEVDPAIDKENTLIPPMLLQPFVENSILHGISSKENGMVKIKIKKEDNIIRCVVEDNGIGREQSMVISGNKEKKQESLGLKITQERLKIINQIKKVKTAINIFDLKDEDNKPRGLRIELSLPFEQAF